MVTSSVAQLPVPCPSFQVRFLDSLGASTVLGLFPTGRLRVVLCFRSDRLNISDFQATDLAKKCCLSLERTLISLGNAGTGGGGEPGSPQTAAWPAVCHRAGAVCPGLTSQNGGRDAGKHEEPRLSRAHCLGFPQQSWAPSVGVLGRTKMWPPLTKSPYFPLRLTYVQVYRSGGISHREDHGSTWVCSLSTTAVLWQLHQDLPKQIIVWSTKFCSFLMKEQFSKSTIPLQKCIFLIQCTHMGFKSIFS